MPFPKPTDVGITPVVHLTPDIVVALFNSAHSKTEGFVPAETVDATVSKWVDKEVKKAGWTAHDTIDGHVVLKFIQVLKPRSTGDASKVSTRAATGPNEPMFGRKNEYPDRI